MPRTKGKYDHKTYYFLPPEERKSRNGFYYVEKLAQTDPQFSKEWHTTANAYHAGRLTKEQAEKKIWQEMQEALQRQR